MGWGCISHIRLERNAPNSRPPPSALEYDDARPKLSGDSHHDAPGTMPLVLLATLAALVLCMLWRGVALPFSLPFKLRHWGPRGQELVGQQEIVEADAVEPLDEQRRGEERSETDQGAHGACGGPATCEHWSDMVALPLPASTSNDMMNTKRDDATEQNEPLALSADRHHDGDVI